MRFLPVVWALAGYPNMESPKFSLLPQEGYLFIGSLKDNITMGAALSEESIKAAVRMAYLEPVLEAHDRNLDIDEGERGATLSGGEIQRVTLARAFAREAPLLLLDETTSALDSRSEAIIEESLQSQLQRCSCLVVAHRLSTVKKADLILVMEKGRIVERGTHRELIALGGRYTDLCGSLL